MDKQIALGYAKDKGYLFEMQTGIATRGAPLGWISFYPEEMEVLLPPCTALEIIGNASLCEGAVVLRMMVVSGMCQLWWDQVGSTFV